MATNYFTKLLKLTRLQARLPITNADGTGTTAFVDLINRAFSNIERSDNSQADLLNKIAQILDIQNSLADDISTLQGQAASQMREAALVGSYTNPTYVLSTTSDTNTATVVVANHQRVYADPVQTTKNVNGTTITGLALNTNYTFFYDDPARAGGTVNIQYSTNNLDGAQGGNRHSLGSIQTPSPNTTTPVEGGGVSPPGAGRLPKYREDQLPEQ